MNGCVRTFAGNKGGSASPIVGDSGFSSNCRASEREGDRDNPATIVVDYATYSREDLVVERSLFPYEIETHHRIGREEPISTVFVRHAGSTAAGVGERECGAEERKGTTPVVIRRPEEEERGPESLFDDCSQRSCTRDSKPRE